MNRRNFIKTGAAFLVTNSGIWSDLNLFKSSSPGDLIVGHNSHQYKVDLEWGALDPDFIPVKDCHEMVQDSKGRIILLTNHTKNNVIIYNKDGKVQKTWGTEFPGAHGLTLVEEGGEDMLYITDTTRHEVIKTTVEGQIIMTLQYPADHDGYSDSNQYLPTETAIAENGDIYVADGYGAQFILHYDSQGVLLNAFGGPGTEKDQFNNAHGICVDNRSGVATLLVTARQQNQLKRFSMDGKWLENISLPGAYICRPVIKGDNVYLATIWSGNGAENSGIISILDKENKLVSAPGGNMPNYKEEVLVPMYQQIKLFKHPHDVCIDEDENMYVAQWNSGQVYPFKMIRV